MVWEVDSRSKNGMRRRQLGGCHKTDDTKTPEPYRVAGEIIFRADLPGKHEQSEGPDEKVHDSMDAIDQEQA